MYYNCSMVLVPFNSKVECSTRADLCEDSLVDLKDRRRIREYFWGGQKFLPTLVQTLGRQLTHASAKL